MNGRILRRHGHRCSVLEMDQAARDRIGRLGTEAQRILTAQDQDLWKRASGPDFLPRLVGGAIILQRIGQLTKKAIILEDDGAHLAFMTCTALAMVSAQLDPALRNDLKQTIKLIASCCPLELTLRSLPPFETLPENFRASEFIRRQYQSFEERMEVPRDVMLDDALALLRIYQKAGRPEDIGILTELIEVTEGLRTALQRVREATTKPETKGPRDETDHRS